METYKIRTRVKENHKILIENLPFEKGEEVEITIIHKTDISTEELMKLQDKGGAFDFLNDEREDNYSVKDLKVKYK